MVLSLWITLDVFKDCEICFRDLLAECYEMLVAGFPRSRALLEMFTLQVFDKVIGMFARQRNPVKARNFRWSKCKDVKPVVMSILD